jgi:DNA-binding transcriptional ArsR family regulator
VSPAKSEHLRAVSEVLFGQRYRLEVMVAIASSQDGLVCLTDLAKDLELTPSNLQNPLRDLVRCGLLSRLPPGDSKRRYYRRNESLAWPFVVEMASQAEGLGLVMEHF